MAQGDEPAELLMDLEMAFGPAQSRRGARLDVEVVRPIRPEDVPVILALQSTSPTQTLKKVTNAHHRLAQLIAQGKENGEVALLTGYDPAYISKIKSDPTFAELVTTYAGERKIVFADVLERMKMLGLSTLDELQSRLADEPEKWTKNELMNLAEMLLVKPMAAKGQQGGGGGSGVNINVNFVDPASPSMRGNVIEGEVVR